MALRMEPMQIRIAGLVARAPAHPPGQLLPEVAYISSEGIHISSAYQFAKAYRFDEQGRWTEKET
jgi:septum site-determining protein MinC